ncbi:fimbria subunit protein [Caballeronia fortuita]|uniref:Fimbria subunit protein n=1 Tax=Caballeronia fortuita TaxID=1777138 RepID=A0A158C009_9BURK|nr:fimbrial protein [Caballeronia fortuita]SAK74857.1 fimbria subunit protein [Caballeronia fortuita]
MLIVNKIDELWCKITLGIRRRHRRCLLSLLGTLALGFGLDARAAVCSISAFPNISFGNVVVPRDAPVGSAIGPLISANVSVYCPANPAPGGYGGFYLQSATVLANSAVAGVSATGTAGIGIRVIDVTFNDQVVSGTTGTVDFGPLVATTSAYSQVYTFTFQLVKTAAQVIYSGPVYLTNFYSMWVHDVPRNTTSGLLASASTSSTITASACTVTTPNVTVTLPTLPATMLASNSTAGKTPFNLNLDCQPGSSVHVTFTDSTAPSNTSSNLSLASGSTASGVVVQLLNSQDVPVRYGRASALPGNMNQWFVGASKGLTTIPLSARYLATGTVIAGVVNALATFTMSYQ